MAKQSNQKAKLLYLQKILMEETDAGHGITIAELVEKLAAVGVAAERKSLYDDVEVLRSMGMDIEVTRGRSNSYKLLSRTVTSKTVVKIAGALKAANTPGANAIIKALCSLLSRYDAEAVKAELAALPEESAAVQEEPAAIAEETAPAAQAPAAAEAADMEAAEKIELKCAPDLQDAVLAYFGERAQIVKTKGSGVVVEALAVCNEDFYVRLIKWGSGVKLTAPADRRKEFVKYCKKILSQYK